MNKITVKIDGMMCGMCEAHICDMIRKSFPDAKKVKASKVKGEASFLFEDPLDTEKLKATIAETGYIYIAVKSEEKKTGLFV